MFKFSSKFLNKNYILYHYSKYLLLTKKKFCLKENFQNFNKNNPISESDLQLFDERVECLNRVHDLKNHFDFYNFDNNKKIINSHLEKKLLYIDYLSSYLNKDFYNNSDHFNTFSNFLGEVILPIKISELKLTEPIYIISLIESLSNLLYYPIYFKDSGKIWIALENLILSTNFLDNLEFNHLYLILKSFQNFFHMEDTILNCEEMLETIEYNLIKLLKSQILNPSNQNGLIILAKIYILFGTNLEGSLEFYEIMIGVLFNKEYLMFLDKNHRSLVIELFYSCLLIKSKVCIGKNIDEFINLLEEQSSQYINDNERIFKNCRLSSEHIHMLEWTKKKLIIIGNKNFHNIKFWLNNKF
jgi:hypothetical protein